MVDTREQHEPECRGPDRTAADAASGLVPVEAALREVRERIATACRAAGRDPAEVTLIAVTKAQAIERIEAALTDRIGVTQAPDMSALTGVLKEIRQVLAERLQRRGAGVGPAAEAVAAAAAGTGLPGSIAGEGQRLVVGEIASREDAIRMLDKICEYFDRHEPSSPVPFLLKRAKTLVAKDFMGILLDLAPGGAEQANLIFGIHSENSD